MGKRPISHFPILPITNATWGNDRYPIKWENSSFFSMCNSNKCIDRRRYESRRSSKLKLHFKK